MTDCFSYMDMNGMGWMMWSAGFFWLLVLTLLILAAAALVKYLRSDRSESHQREHGTIYEGRAQP